MNQEEVDKQEKSYLQGDFPDRNYYRDITPLGPIVGLIFYGMVLFECFSIMCWCFSCVFLLDPVCQIMDYMPFSIQFMYEGWAILPQSWYGIFFFATFGVTVYLNAP